MLALVSVSRRWRGLNAIERKAQLKQGVFNLTTMELVSILRQMYHGAPDGETVTMVHLFGVKFADQIRDCGASVKDLTVNAGLPETYLTEIKKAMNLAKYVDVKPSFTPPQSHDRR